MMLGLAAIAVPLALFASASELSIRVVALLAVAGLSNVAGLALQYQAFKRGKVGVVMAIASTEGMIATLVTIGGGASMSLDIFLVLLLITTGLVVTALAPDIEPTPTQTADGRRTVLLALPVPILGGMNLFAIGELGSHVSLLWAVLPGRLAGSALIGVPLIAKGKLTISRRVFPLLAAAAAAEIVGFAAYTWGSRSEIAISAVLASEYAAIAAAGAYVLFSERLGRRQLSGLILVAVGVATLSALSG